MLSDLEVSDRSRYDEEGQGEREGERRKAEMMPEV
jgi:hypothetical protein